MEDHHSGGRHHSVCYRVSYHRELVTKNDRCIE